MDKSQSLLGDAVFETHLKSLRDMPDWLIELKKEAWARYKALPFPVRKNEMWRFAHVDGLALDDFVHDDTQGKRECELLICDCGADLNFSDDAHVGGKTLSEELAKAGVLFMPLELAIREHPELVRKHLFERMPDMGSEKYQALHVALFSTGVFLYVPRGVQVELPFQSVHSATREGGSVFPHTLVVAEEGASVTLFDIFRSSKENIRHFACAAADIYATAGANVRYRLVQAWSGNALAFHLNSATAGAQSVVDAITINIGGAHIRGEQHGRIIGKGGEVIMNSLSLARGKQEIDQRTLQTHDAEDGHSDLLYKNVLLDQAHTIFSGLIRVAEGAQRTDAYQTNRNLLLSPDAESDSLPGLEILANDVKCSHGSSTGQLDDEQLFYMLARGIPRRQAQELLVFGFFEEIIAKIGNPHMADYVRQLLQDSFSLQ